MRSLALFIVLASASAGAADRGAFDLVVIGGTPAGIAAAIAGGRAGVSVALVEETPVLGGMLSNGVSRADDAVIASNSGVFEEFRRRIRDYHLKNYPTDPVVLAHGRANMVRHNVARGQAWEPKIAAKIYAAMVAEHPSIKTFFREVPVRALTRGHRIEGVVTRGAAGAEYTYRGKVIVDATYEADVAAFAGAAFQVGREPATPEEPHAGEIFTDAFCEGVRALPGTIFPGGSGRGDRKLMAYNFRFIVKDYGTPNGPHRLKTPPPGYNAKRYKWNAATPPYLPNRKLDVLTINWGNDTAGVNYDYPTATWEQRARIVEYYKNYALGYLYYIQNDGGSPRYGLADDEFTDNGNFPYKMYVRQARRIDGTYRLTESDIHKDLGGNGLRGPLHRDSVAIGLYELDAHNVVDPVDRASPCSGEGAINLKDVTGPYQLPYGVMVPVKVDGLLVPVGISSTHVAMTSVRMEPVWSALGHAAGVAAAIAIGKGLDVRKVNVTEVQDGLLRQGNKLFFYQDTDQDHTAFAAIQRASVLGGLDGDDNYYFRPTHPIAKGDLARLLIRALEVPISITGQHFIDAPRGHPAFQYIETLYDAGTRQAQPFLVYEPRDYLAYAQHRLTRVYVYPQHPVDHAGFMQLLEGILRHKGVADPQAVLAKAGGIAAEGWVSRAEAAKLVMAVRSALARPQ